jgi:hypothetical protein
MPGMPGIGIFCPSILVLPADLGQQKLTAGLLVIRNPAMEHRISV